MKPSKHQVVSVLVLSSLLGTLDSAVPTTDIQTEQYKLLASDGAWGDHFGGSVSISGDTAVIGADDDGDHGGYSGSAYVFVRNGDGWTEQQKLLASDGAVSDYFGQSVAVSGDTVVIGADSDDNGFNSGSAYVFVRDGGVWTEQDKLLASDGAEWDAFGSTVSISGNTVVIGAVFDSDSDNESGSAYVFVRDGGVWTEQQKLLASDGAAFDRFGRSVAISGDTVVIGADGDDDNGSRSGSAYVFVRSNGVWTEQDKFLASDGTVDDYFGRSIAISGETAVIGAWGDDTQGSRAGAAYVFGRTGETWTEQDKLLASDGTFNDSFGLSVAISGDSTVIGASGNDNPNGTSSGSAYVFVRSDGVWIEQTKIAASDGAAYDAFGNSVCISGKAAVVGAYLDDDNDDSSGSAYLFLMPVIFTDDFESGNTSAWSDTVP